MAKDVWDMTDEELESAVESEREEQGVEESTNEDSEDTEAQSIEDIVSEVTEQPDEPEESTDDEVQVTEDKADEEGSETENVEESPEPETNDGEGQETEAQATTNVYKPLIVDGEEIPIHDLDELYTMASAGGRVTQKFQELAKHRRTISAIQEAGLTDEDINTLIEAQKGDKNAIAALVKKAGVDPLDIDEDNAEGYTPGQYGMSDKEQAIVDIQQSISKDAEYQTTAHIVDEVWDDASRSQIIENPNIILGLHNDIKSGLYDKVAPEAKKLAIADGMRRPAIEYYVQAGQLVTQSMQLNNAQDPVQEQKEQQRSAKRKSAGGHKGKRVAKKAEINFDEMSDDEAWAIREKIMSRV